MQHQMYLAKVEEDQVSMDYHKRNFQKLVALTKHYLHNKENQKLQHYNAIVRSQIKTQLTALANYYKRGY